MAKTPRTWTGARTPSGLKRVRQSQRRHDVLGPRRSAAKTYVAKALTVAASPAEGQDPAAALNDALSALDRAAKAGAIHPNAAARRKSRLTRKVNAALGGATVQTSARVTKQTGKAAKARIAAGKSAKAKGAQTAAGKARAALSKTARAEAAAAAAAQASTAATAEAPVKAPAKAKATAAKSTTSKTTAKAAPAKATAKPAATAKAAPKKKTADKS